MVQKHTAPDCGAIYSLKVRRKAAPAAAHCSGSVMICLLYTALVEEAARAVVF